MEELIVKVDNLINKIDSLELIKDIKNLNSKILLDSDLNELIHNYKINQKDSLRDEIISNELFMDYKHKEVELNLLIMGINQRLKEINNRGICK